MLQLPEKVVPFSSVQYTSGKGVAANASNVVGDGLGATLGSFFFNLNRKLLVFPRYMFFDHHNQRNTALKSRVHIQICIKTVWIRNSVKKTKEVTWRLLSV